MNPSVNPQDYKVYVVGKTTYYIYILIFFYSFVAGCEKDPDSNNNSEECIPILPCNKVTIGGGNTYILDANSETCPFFNPNNDNEFLFASLCTGNISEKCIRIFNMQTKHTNTIYTGSLYYAPQWGKNDWILFCQSDWNIYKIKSNGDSLIQLTDEGCYHYPKWFFEDNKFIAFNQCLQKDILFGINGTILDTLPKMIIPTTSFGKFPYVLGNGGISGGVQFYNFLTNTVEHKYDYSHYVNSSQVFATLDGSIFWVNNNEVIYSNINGLNRLSIPNMDNKYVKISCNSKTYQYGDINGNKTKMLWSRTDYNQIDECTLEYKISIFIMDVDGTNEQEIQLN